MNEKLGPICTTSKAGNKQKTTSKASKENLSCTNPLAEEAAGTVADGLFLLREEEESSHLRRRQAAPHKEHHQHQLEDHDSDTTTEETVPIGGGGAPASNPAAAFGSHQQQQQQQQQLQPSLPHPPPVEPIKLRRFGSVVNPTPAGQKRRIQSAAAFHRYVFE